MIKATIEEGFRISLPEIVRGWLHIGDEVMIDRDSDGRIVIASATADSTSLYPMPHEESQLGRQLREIRQRIVLSGAHVARSGCT